MHIINDVKETGIASHFHSYASNDYCTPASQRASQDVIDFTSALTNSQLRVPLHRPVVTEQAIISP